LNAGDELPQADTVEKMMLKYTPDTDVFFGETNLVTFTRHNLGTRSQLTTQKLPTALTWESLRLGMVVCHQAFIARRAIAPAYMYGNLAADIDWVIEVLKKSRKTVNTGQVLANYLTGGVSKQRHRQSLKDRYAVLKKHYGQWPNLLAHAQIVLRSIFAKNKY
ncbi:MAG: hypothetical protein MUC59_16840, partial [Saprospiraceae bacterium]|nr:hypothetical protein [Saprospiraceae bacterium]